MSLLISGIPALVTRKTEDAINERDVKKRGREGVKERDNGHAWY